MVKFLFDLQTALPKIWTVVAEFISNGNDPAPLYKGCGIQTASLKGKTPNEYLAYDTKQTCWGSSYAGALVNGVPHHFSVHSGLEW